MSADVAVVIVTHNGESCIRAALGSLAAERSVLQTIVVDNASSDGTKAIVGEFPGVTLVVSETNRGFGGAHGLALSVVAPAVKYLFLLNQDAFLLPGAIDELRRIAVAYLRHAVLSPLQLEASAGPLDHGFATFGLADAQRVLLADAVRGRTREVYDVAFAPAAAWLLRKSAFEQLGGFSPAFFQYGEDQQFCQRVALAGWAIGACPSAEVIHARSARVATDGGSASYVARVRARAALEVMDVRRPFARSVMALPLRSGRRVMTLLSAGRLGAAWVEVSATALVLGKLPRLARLWKRERQLALAVRRDLQ